MKESQSTKNCTGFSQGARITSQAPQCSMSSSTKTPPNSEEEEKKKSKLQKIFELQADRKRLKEENKSLRKQLDQFTRGNTSPSRKRTQKSSDEEKLMAAMSALKRVTVKQEQSLCSLRSKAEQRRQQIAEKDAKISSLKKEVAKLKRSLKARKDTSNNDDVDTVRAKVEDLQISCAEQESRNAELQGKLEESEERVKNLQKQLDSARGLIKGSPSAKSIMSSGEMSMSEMDVAKLRKDLANKIERIVLLEFDLEMCKDELHELRQTRSSSAASYPAQDAQNYEAADFDGSFYSDLSDEDDDDEVDYDDEGWK